LLATTESTITENTRKLLAILVAMQIRWNYRLMEHIPGITRSHWMPPSGNCLHRIAPAAAMVDKFVEKTQTRTKNYF
jgi:hypothetical protein